MSLKPEQIALIKQQAKKLSRLVWGKARALQDWLGRATYPVLLALYTAILSGGIVWKLNLLRDATDPYIRIPVTFDNIWYVVWPAFVAAYVAVPLIKRLKKDTGLQNHGALIVIFCALQPFGLTYYGYEIFQLQPRSHIAEEIADLNQFFGDGNVGLPEKVNEFTTLKQVSYRHRMVTFEYDILEKEGYFWNVEKIQRELGEKACIIFQDLTQYGGITMVHHLLYNAGAVKYSFAYTLRDCPQVKLGHKTVKIKGKMVEYGLSQ